MLRIRIVAAMVVMLGLGAFMGIASPFNPHHSAVNVEFRPEANTALMAGPGPVTNPQPNTTDSRKFAAVYHANISACEVGSEDGFPAVQTKSADFTYAPAAGGITEGSVYEVSWVKEIKPFAGVIIAAKLLKGVKPNCPASVPTVIPTVIVPVTPSPLAVPVH